MKKIMLSILVVFLTVTLAIAHPPKAVNINYIKSEKKVTIEAIHKVSNVESHYIYNITIYVNNIEKKVLAITKQTSTQSEVATYEIGDLKAGDIVKVTASCNKFGSKSNEFQVK